MASTLLSFGSVVGLMAIGVLAATPAWCQTGSPRPPLGGLFGATRIDIASRDASHLLVDASEGLDNELSPEFRTHVPGGDLQGGGFSSLLTATGDYTHIRRRLLLAATGSAAFRYYQRLDQVASVNHQAGLEATIRLPRQASLQLTQTAAYAPSYLYQLFPAGGLDVPQEPISADPDYRIDETASYSYATSAVMTVGSSRSVRMTATAGYSLTDFQQQQTTTRPNRASYRADVRVSRLVSRNGGLSLQYQYNATDYESRGSVQHHQLTVGADYSRPLSGTRRATFRVDVSPPGKFDISDSFAGAVQNLAPVDSSGGPVTLDVTDHFSAGASVSYPFLPRWQLAADYRRAIRDLNGLSEPVAAEGARLELTGFFGRSVDIAATAGYATAASVLGTATEGLQTSTARLRFRYAVKRSLAFYSEYLFYHYDLRQQTRLAPDLPSVFDQQGIRIGVMLFGTLSR